MSSPVSDWYSLAAQTPASKVAPASSSAAVKPWAIEVDRLLQDRRVGAVGRAEVEAAAVRSCDRALGGAGFPGAGGGPAGDVAGLGVGVGERHGDAAERDVGVAELDQRAGAASAARGPGADREHVDAVAVDDGGVVGAGADDHAGAGRGPDRDREAAGGGVVDEVGLAVVGDDDLGIGGERAGQAQHLALRARPRHRP